MRLQKKWKKGLAVLLGAALLVTQQMPLYAEEDGGGQTVGEGQVTGTISSESNTTTTGRQEPNIEQKNSGESDTDTPESNTPENAAGGRKEPELHGQPQPLALRER